MKNVKIATVIALILMLILPMMAAGADVDIDITTDSGDVDLDITTGNGTLLTIDYEGRDLISEIAAKIKTIADLRSTIIALAMRNDVEDLEDQLAELEEALQKLIDELNLVLNDLYSKLSTQAHVMGINPGNTTVSITLISGNMTIADYLNDILIELNATDQEFVSIQLQLEDIYTGMMEHDTLIMNDRYTIRELNITLSVQNTSLNARITSLTERFRESFSDALEQIWATDMELKSQIDLQGMDINELYDELASTNAVLKMTQDSIKYITIMFGVFSIICIGVVVVGNRPSKPVSAE